MSNIINPLGVVGKGKKLHIVCSDDKFKDWTLCGIAPVKITSYHFNFDLVTCKTCRVLFKQK